MCNIEIGSDFWEYNSKENNCELELFKEEEFNKNSILVSSGRNSIRLLLENLNLGKKILIPGFTCETVIEPFIDYGYEVEFYNIKKNLEVDLNDFNEKIKKFNPSLVLVHSYFGFNTLNNFWKYIKNNDFKFTDIVLIEDITQIIFSNNISSLAKYKVGSLRKWFAIPDGGVLTTKEMNFNSNHNENKKQIELFIKACDLKSKYVDNNVDTKKMYREAFHELKNEINKKTIFSMSKISKNIFLNNNFDYIKEKRIENYNILYENLSDIESIEYLLGRANKNEIPLYFPILIKKNREEIQSELAKNSIFCPIVWPKSKFVEKKIKFITELIYEKILCIPCDQRYSVKDMERIIEVIRGIK